MGLKPRENGYGLIDDCTTSRTGDKQINGVMLRPDDPDMEKKKDDCFRRASYLAKTNSKGNAPKFKREMFSSRIPKKQLDIVRFYDKLYTEKQRWNDENIRYQTT